ncbi:MAG: hypothetical protein V1707_02695 [bacterium]
MEELKLFFLVIALIIAGCAGVILIFVLAATDSSDFNDTKSFIKSLIRDIKILFSKSP